MDMLKKGIAPLSTVSGRRSKREQKRSFAHASVPQGRTGGRSARWNIPRWPKVASISWMTVAM